MNDSRFRVKSDKPFMVGIVILCSVYILLIVLMVVADIAYTDTSTLLATLRDPNIRYAIVLSLGSCTISTLLYLWVALPIGSLM